MEPLNKGHVGTRSFVLYREVSFIQRLKCTAVIGIGTSRFVLYKEVLYSECPLSEVLLYTDYDCYTTKLDWRFESYT